MRMKRTLSIILAVTMLLSVLAIVPATSAGAADLSSGNVGITANYFGGALEYYKASGTGTRWKTEKTPSYTRAAKDANAGTIKLNGVIDEGEWGNNPYYISSKYAPNNGGKVQAKNKLFESPSGENTYFYYDVDSNKKPYKDSLEYTVYLLWDEDYLYVAAQTLDTDGHGNKNGGDSAWNGDALQFRVDSKGPNATAEAGNTYSAEGYIFPWSRSTRKNAAGAQETYSETPNFIFTYIASGKGYTECWDAARRYSPTVNDQGETVYNQSSVGSDGTHGKGIAYATVYPKITRNPDNPTECFTTYEIAVPWSLIDDAADFMAQAGLELGFSAALINGANGSTTMNSYLEWGSGICGNQIFYNPQTAGGSNCLTLSGTSYKDVAAHTHSFAAATCTEPETCACGYKRGFANGHVYKYSNVSLPSDAASGNITATCTVCNYTFSKELVNGEAKSTQSFTSADSTIHDKNFDSGYTSQWKYTNDAGESLPVYNADGTAKCAYDKYSFWQKEDGTVVYDPSTITFNSDEYVYTYAGSQREAYDKTGAVSKDFAVLNLDMDYAGTYYSGSSIEAGKVNFTLKTDVYFTGFRDSNPWGYLSGLYYWFGDDDGMGYLAGYFRLTDGTNYFGIVPKTYDTSDYAHASADFEQHAIVYTKVDEATLGLNQWNELVFAYDNSTQTALIYYNDALVAAATDYHFDYKSSDGYTVIRNFDMNVYLTNIDFGNFYLVKNYVQNSAAETKTVTVNGVAYGEYEVGEAVEVTVDKTFFYDASGMAERFTGWKYVTDVDGVTVAITDSTKSTVTFDMPAANVELTAIYALIGDADKSGRLTVADVNFIKRMLVGLVPTNSEADVDNDGRVSTADVNYIKKMIVGAYKPAS